MFPPEDMTPEELVLEGYKEGKVVGGILVKPKPDVLNHVKQLRRALKELLESLAGQPRDIEEAAAMSGSVEASIDNAREILAFTKED